MHIVITGASSGIGDAIARAFDDGDSRLTLIARRAKRLEALAGELSVDCHVQPADLSDPDAFVAALDGAEAALGPIDALINNAGIQYVEPTAGIDAERIRRLIDDDLTTPLVGIHRVLPGMLERGRGCIVNIASMAGITHTPGMAHYNAAKAGLGAASESMRVELQGTGVHVLTVYPGPVTSAMESAARSAYAESPALRNVPTGTPAVLARRIRRAMEKESARVVYPGVYGVSRYTRVLSQWMVDRFTPALRDERG